MALDVKNVGFFLLLIAIAVIGSVKSEEYTAEETQSTGLVKATASPWSFLRNLFYSNSESNVGESRTFGKIRRLQMAIIPLVFKFGILSTLIYILVALGVKTIFLLKTLLILNLVGLVAKFFIWKSSFGGGGGYSNNHATTYSQWTPPSHHISPHHEKEVHLHIHNDGNGHSNLGNEKGSWESSYIPEHHVDPYAAYSGSAPTYTHQVNRRNYRKIPINLNRNNY